MTAVRRKKELVDNLIKDEIVKTVLTLVQKEHAITMDEIAKQCGIAKGTLYNYFANKEELLNYVHDAVILPMQQTHNAIFESPKDPLDKLHEFIEAVFNVREDVYLYFHFVQDKKTVGDAINERHNFMIRPLVKLCSQGIQKGNFIDVDPYVLAEMIYGTVVGPVKFMLPRCAQKHDRKKIKTDIICLIDKIILK
ncbi:MAG: TetR/AcrR family transcriptional regulator [Desulfobacteraceae bacterium]|nr:TetR/AcrR family transcriptional regulator [Desulfobacteraceae bacterium]